MSKNPQRRYEDFTDPDLDAFIEATMKEFHSPGMAVLVVHRNRIWAKGYGFSNLERQTPVTPETLFFAGSTTKSFTASMAAHLVESEDHPMITWQTPLAEMIREDFVLDQSTPVGQWTTTHVTMEDCLSHRTGQPRHDLAWVNGFKSNREVVRSLRHLPMHRDMRTQFEYSNNPYTAVSYAVEDVLDEPYKESLQRLIFDPLRMEQTTYTLEDARKVAKDNNIDLATGYLWNSNTESYEPVPWSDIPPSRGSGGIISNVLDYATWVQHLMKPTNLNNTALSENAVKALRTPKMLFEGDRPFVGPQAYCFGLQSHIYRGREILDHDGAIAGYMASMIMIPPTPAEIERGDVDGGWALVSMANSYSAAQGIICWHLLDRCLETPVEERLDAAKKAREAQAKAEEALKPDKVVKRLFGLSAEEPRLDPALQLSAYEGVYEHPGYGEMQVSATPLRGTNSSVQTGKAVLYLAPPESKKGYLSLAATLHHVNGEWWWSHQTAGPSSWMVDKALKAHFIISAKGAVEGMGYQAEAEMPDELAFFKKIS